MLLTEADSDDPGTERYLSSQAIMLAMKGIPGIYFHGLFGTRNDIEAARQSGIPRRINRRKFGLDEINARLTDEQSLPHRILDKYKQLLKIRSAQAAFHPDAIQRVCQTTNPSILAFQRECTQTGQLITVVTNFSSSPQTLPASELGSQKIKSELVSGRSINENLIELAAFETLWLQHQQP